jgi:uncharacterized membrane protein
MEEKAVSLELSRNLGGVGAILLLVGTLPYVSSYSFGILVLVGLILILIGLNGLANVYRERGIFNNSLYGVIAGIVGGVVAAVVLFVSVLGTLADFLQKSIHLGMATGQRFLHFRG